MCALTITSGYLPFHANPLLEQRSQKGARTKARKYFPDSSTALEPDLDLLFRNSYFEMHHRTLRQHLEEPHECDWTAGSVCDLSLISEPSLIRPPSIEQRSEFYQGDFTALVSVGGRMRGYPSGEETKDIIIFSPLKIC
jgi:hypothetical protein